MANSVVNLSLQAKSTPTVNITVNEAGSVSGTGSVSPVIKFVASGEVGPTGAQGIQGTISGSDVVTTSNIQNGAVSTAKLADDSVTADKLGPNSVYGAAIPDLGIDTTKIGNDAVTSAKIADNAVTSAHIAPNAITEELIESGIITRASIADNTIDSSKIQNYTLVTTDFSLNSVDGTVIVDNPTIAGDVSAVNYKSRGASPGKFEGPDSDEMHLKFHTTLKYVNTSGTVVGGMDQSGNFTLSGTVDGIDIATDVAANTNKVSYPSSDSTKVGHITVTQAINLDTDHALLGTHTNQIAAIDSNNWVTTAKILDGNVTTNKLEGNAVTTIKIQDSNVTTAKIADSNITTAKIADNAITTAKVLDGNITTNKLEGNAVTSAKIGDNQVVTSKIPDNAITTAKILDGNITTNKLEGNAVTTAKIGDGQVTAVKIPDGDLVTAKFEDGAITAPKIASNAVTTVKILDGNVTTNKLEGNAVTTAKITDASVTADKLAADSVTSAKVADNAITTDSITDGHVTTNKLEGNAVTTAKITNNAITTDKITDGHVTGNKLEGGAVTTDKIGDSQVTTAKIADGNVTGNKLEGGAVTTAKIGDNQVTTAKIADGNVTGNKLEGGAVTTDKVGDNQITTAKILDGNVTGNKLEGGAVTTAKIGDGQVTGNKLEGGAVTTAKIGDDQVTADKLANSINSAIAANTSKVDLTVDGSGTIHANNVGTLNQSTTGNAATATALAAGNQTIDGDVTIGANDEGHDLLVYGHTANANMFWNASEDFLKFSDLAKIVFGTGVAAGDFDSSIQANGSNLVIYNDTGNIQIGDTVEITGDLTVSGNLSIGNDAEITSVGSMVFRIDSDANESSQKFTWKNNASDVIAEINEEDELVIYGSSSGDPRILLHQTGQNNTYGPPQLDFYREDTLVDNADLGMINFIAKDSADNDQTYAKIIGLAEESGSGTEGGKIKLQVATHDGEIQTGITIEDGDAEDEIDVTIANGSSSLTTVAGNLNITTSIELGHASDTTIARTAAGTVSIEGKEIVTINKQKNIHSYAYHYSGTSAHFIPMSGATTSDSTGLTATSYHLMQVMPFDGRVVRIAVFNQSTTSRTDLFEMYIDGDDSDPSGDQRGTDLSFTSTQKGNGDCATDWTFSKGEAIAIRRTPSAAVNGTTITVVFEFDMTT